MFIQSNADTFGSLSPAVILDEAVLAFNNPNGSLNCIVVDILWQGQGPGSSRIPVSVSDTNGNTYFNVFNVWQTNGDLVSCWVANQIAAGLNVVTVSQASTRIGLASIAIHEYDNIDAVTAVDAHNISFSSVNGTTETATLTTTHDADVLHMFGCTFAQLGGGGVNVTGESDWFGRTVTTALSSFDVNKTSAGTYSGTVFCPQFATDTLFCGIVALRLVTPESPVPAPGDAWILIDDGPGYTDRSTYLSFSSEHETHSFSAQMRQRGTASIPLRIKDGDTYLSTPTDLNDIIGVQVFLYDQTEVGAVPVFCGTVDTLDVTWDGYNATRIVLLTVTSFESCYDVIYPAPQFWQNQAADQIALQLLAKYPAIPVYLGTVQPGVNVPEFYIDGQTRLSDVINTLAGLCNFIWGVNPAGQSFYFCSPSAAAAPFILNSDTPTLFGTWNYKLNRQDYRNRQMVKGNVGAFGQSSQLFPGQGSSGNQQYYVRNPIDTITGVFQTKSTQNTAHGTFTGQPSPGDTVSIGTALEGWTPSTLYGDPSAIVDSNGHIQAIGSYAGQTIAGTQFGTSGSSTPTWSKVGGLTIDGTCVWCDLGPTLATYTFVTALDNTQWGQVLIGASEFQTWNAFIDAVNCNYAVRGITFSLPTWEHVTVNIDQNYYSTTFTVRAKAAGTSFNASLSKVCAAFSWSAASMSGGTNGSGTVVLSSGVAGVDTSAQVLFNQGGTQVVTAPFYAVPTGWFIQVQYTRVAAAVVICEDSTLVQERAVIEQGTGMYQQLTSDSTNTSNVSLLQECQGALAAYSVIPQELNLEIFQPGLLPGQLLTIETEDSPEGIGIIAGSPSEPQTWVVFEISAMMIPCDPYLKVPGAGHFRYTIKLINQSQIGSYLDFWEGLASGGGGVGSGIAGAISGTNGAPPGGPNIEVTQNNNPVNY